ncbi:hypothetical protein N7537_001978 [Penicillium hordei]|uniref:Uncharacterized protein n=1 Tax=Penicillium hordei TaxID=40994 RepID=A0AAD6EGG6_9EURO|nr:uncharacterized protein N7537_001978 [Penicillium hordei]KAJ5616864.1 hypothetical protein N7537_001978 [Penicillium hordei]
MKRHVSHQYFTLRSDKRYKMELQWDTAIDAVGNTAILLGDFDKCSKSTLLRLTDIEGYHIECSDKSTNPETLRLTAALRFTGSIGRGYQTS